MKPATLREIARQDLADFLVEDIERRPAVDLHDEVVLRLGDAVLRADGRATLAEARDHGQHRRRAARRTSRFRQRVPATCGKPPREEVRPPSRNSPASSVIWCMRLVAGAGCGDRHGPARTPGLRAWRPGLQGAQPAADAALLQAPAGGSCRRRNWPTIKLIAGSSRYSSAGAVAVCPVMAMPTVPTQCSMPVARRNWSDDGR